MIKISSLVCNRCNLNREINHGKSSQHWIEVSVDQVASFRHGDDAEKDLTQSLAILHSKRSKQIKIVSLLTAQKVIEAHQDNHEPGQVSAQMHRSKSCTRSMMNAEEILIG